MFTGIVTAVGHIVETRASSTDAGAGLSVTVEAPAHYLEATAPGDSVAVSGACMTVTRIDAGRQRFDIDVSAESLARTAGLQRPGRVNLEFALSAGDRLGGHLVSGHVDGIGTVIALQPVGESTELRLHCATDLARFVAVKGSLVVNGVSLTVNAVADGDDGCAVSINLIPHTMAHTTLGELQSGQAVNLEVDLIARYVERLLAAPSRE